MECLASFQSVCYKLPDKWVAEEGAAPKWAGGLHVRYKLTSTPAYHSKIWTTEEKSAKIGLQSLRFAYLAF
jgi:hypothetical protein